MIKLHKLYINKSYNMHTNHTWQYLHHTKKKLLKFYNYCYCGRELVISNLDWKDRCYTCKYLFWVCLYHTQNRYLQSAHICSISHCLSVKHLGYLVLPLESAVYNKPANKHFEIQTENKVEMLTKWFRGFNCC